MIHSFSCKNFYSFGDDLTTVSFVVNNIAPKTYGYFKALSGTRLSKIETVIGPNASGKTNLLKVVPFLKWLIIDSFNINPSAFIPVLPFIFYNYKNQPTELSVEFEINKNIYIYNFSLTKTRILLEELRVKNKSKQKTTSKRIFYRLWNDKTNQYNFEGKNFNPPKGFNENSLRSNASVIGVLMRLNHKQSQEISKFWQNVETNVAEAGWIGDRLLPNATQQLIETFKFYSENSEIKNEADKFLSTFDLGLDAIEILKKESEDGFSINVHGVHSFDTQNKNLDIRYESSGTKQLFVLLKTILQVLASGGVAVLDEFDVNLHPEIVLSLFDLFVQPETNPNNAQLLFSTHSHLVLSKVDKYQIIFVEKDKKGLSESWRMDEMSGIRADDNYYSKYIAGAYGAIPNIR
ncbi:MAG: AAA family ATPase [Patescibacteria group bacterium]